MKYIVCDGYMGAGKCFIRQDSACWVVFYPATSKSIEYWQAYKAIKKTKEPMKPWCVDNRRIGKEDGFKSLEDAVAAADSVQAEWKEV